MDSYNADEKPSARMWLNLDEFESLSIVEQYHQQIGDTAPNEMLHAMMHVVIENQLAADDPAEAARTLARLMKAGLDRHDAIHALASVQSEIMFEFVKGTGAVTDPNQEYEQALKRLTAKGWLAAQDPSE